MLQFDDVSKSYMGGLQAVQGVSFGIKPGEFVYLRGHSGAGKTTLFKLISAIERPTSGKIVFDGEVVSDMPRSRIPYLRRRIGMIFQDYRLINTATVYDNVALPLEIEGYSDSEIEKRVLAAIDRVGLIKKERCYPLMLSGGEQQRVGIARAIAHMPKLLVADEPTGNLDSAMAREILRLFDELSSNGRMTVLLATHDDNMLKWRPGRQIILEKGRLAADIPQGAAAHG